MASKPRYLIKILYSAGNGSYYLVCLSFKEKGTIWLPLSTLDYLKLTDEDYRNIYDAIDSDGCTGVPDFYLNGCIIHDFYYATHCNFDGSPIDRAEADKRFREYIQRKSLYGKFSPMSWWRWLAVRLFGSKAWNKLDW